MLKLRKIGMICFLGLCIVMTGGCNGKNEKEGMDATRSQAEEMTTTDTEDESQLDFANNYKQYEKFLSFRSFIHSPPILRALL